MKHFNNMYKMCYTKTQMKKVDKIISGISLGTITKENYWDQIRVFTKNVTSDSSIGEWQRYAEIAYEYLLAKEFEENLK